MDITCVADLHCSYNLINIPKSDILICAGDIDAFDEAEIARFNRWLGKQQTRYNIVIGGNHDAAFAQNGYKAISNALTNAIYLENSGVTIEGINFYGSPQTPTFQNWYFMCERNKIKRYWDMIPDNTNVLITHGPPFGILDFAILDKKHVGCEELLKRIQQIKPKYHIFGHIHHGYGQQTIGDTTFVNASIMDENYEPVNKPILITI